MQLAFPFQLEILAKIASFGLHLRKNDDWSKICTTIRKSFRKRGSHALHDFCRKIAENILWESFLFNIGRFYQGCQVRVKNPIYRVFDLRFGCSKDVLGAPGFTGFCLVIIIGFFSGFGFQISTILSTGGTLTRSEKCVILFEKTWKSRNSSVPNTCLHLFRVVHL